MPKEFLLFAWNFLRFRHAEIYPEIVVWRKIELFLLFFYNGWRLELLKTFTTARWKMKWNFVAWKVNACVLLLMLDFLIQSINHSPMLVPLREVPEGKKHRKKLFEKCPRVSKREENRGETWNHSVFITCTEIKNRNRKNWLKYRKIQILWVHIVSEDLCIHITIGILRTHRSNFAYFYSEKGDNGLFLVWMLWKYF